MGDDLIPTEVRRMLADALSRFGVAGTVGVGDDRATLDGHGPTVEVPLDGLADHWDGLPPEQRQRRINDIARRLAAERRSIVAGSTAPAAFALPAWAGPLATAVIAVVALFGAFVAYKQWFSGDTEPEKRERSVIRDYDAYERERLARAARVCEATRSRVMRGAAVGPADAEGWVVELWVLRDPARPSPASDPALATFVPLVPGQAKRRFGWSGAPSVVGLDGPDTAAELVESNVPETGPAAWRGVRLVLTGRYVVPYFHETERFEYVRFARAYADALGAEHAALYARCSDGRSHHLGSWFLGPSPGGAVASLLLFIGSFGDISDVRRSLLVPEGASDTELGFAFTNIVRATAALKKTSVMAMVGAEGGMIAGLDGQRSTIGFPFRDANRAARASRVIARDLGIGEGR